MSQCEYNKLSEAIKITSSAFEGELDKGGMPYILHCLHVMNVVAKKSNKDPELMQIAVMHDLVEDIDYYTFDALRSMGFSERVIAGIDSVTKREYKEVEDNRGKTCEKCGKGTYGETSQHDDMDGLFHCNKCGHEVESRIVTKTEEAYGDFILRCAKNRDGIMVKLADLKHNMDPTRMKGLRDKDFERIEKYHRSYAFLSGVKVAACS
jgi:(p)ppGpp synthase/HD superfamily hydrolase